MIFLFRLNGLRITSVICFVFSVSQNADAQNLLLNGDFESGSNGVGFSINSSAYNELTSPFSGTTSPGNYARVTNPQPLHPAIFIATGDHTTGTGYMLAVDGTTVGGQQRFWRAGSNGGGVCGLTVGDTYTFKYWIRSVSTEVTGQSTRADIGIQFNNTSNVTLVSGAAMAPLPTVGWQEVVYTFVATNNCVNIEMYDNNTSAVGNDFALDDFQLIPPVQPLTADYTLLNNACVAGFIAVYANGGVLPYSYTLSGGANQTNLSGIFEGLYPGTYTVTITDAEGSQLVLDDLIISANSDLSVSPDVSICPGESVSISVSGGSGNYTWSASPVDPSLVDVNSATPTASPSQTTEYTVSDGSKTTYNLITNGDFESGNESFYSQYLYMDTNPIGQQSRYGIVQNSAAWYSGFASCTDHSGSGNMLVMDGSTTVGGTVVLWGQTVPVTPGTTYNFGYFVQSISPTSPAVLNVYINDVLIGTHTASTVTCNWQEVTHLWNSESATTAAIRIVDSNTAGIGNDIALDDITMNETGVCGSSASIVVTVNAVAGPEITCSSTDVSVTFVWNPVAGAASYDISYSIDGGGSLEDTITETSYTVGNLGAGSSINITVLPIGSGCYSAATLSCSTPVCPVQIVPTFTPVSLCVGSNPEPLQTVSLEGIIGTWYYDEVQVDEITTDVTAEIGFYVYAFVPDAGQCAGNTTLTVEIVAAGTLSFDPLEVCQGGQAVLPSVGEVTGNWSQGTNLVTGIDTTQLGNYVYVFTPDTGQCMSAAELTVTINPTTAISFAPLTVCFRRSLAFPVETDEGYELQGTWSPAILDTSVTGETIYHFTPADGCYVSGSYTVTVQNCRIPKGVSPNDDGNNDAWDLSNFNIRKVQIFNRYGMQVYSRDNYENQWEGQTDDGHVLPTGPYYYRIDFDDMPSQTGWVYLII